MGFIHQFLPLRSQRTLYKRDGKMSELEGMVHTKETRPSKAVGEMHIELTETMSAGPGPEWRSRHKPRL